MARFRAEGVEGLVVLFGLYAALVVMVVVAFSC